MSARPEWVEIVAPCSLAVADRIQAFVMQLETEPAGRSPRIDRLRVPGTALQRDRVGREAGSDAEGSHLLSSRPAHALVSHRRPGRRVQLEGLEHAAISNPEGDPLQHAFVREEKGLRPGGLGLAITRTLVDELIYNEARNEVVFVKYLDGNS